MAVGTESVKKIWSILMKSIHVQAKSLQNIQSVFANVFRLMRYSNLKIWTPMDVVIVLNTFFFRQCE